MTANIILFFTEDDFRLGHVRGEVLTRTECQGHWGDLVDNNMICFGNGRRGGCSVGGKQS